MVQAAFANGLMKRPVATLIRRVFRKIVKPQRAVFEHGASLV